MSDAVTPAPARTGRITGGAPPFQKGQSGNPKGRPVGSRNRVSLACDELLEGEAEAITRKAIEMAKDGDGPALRLCLDRIAPARKDRPVPFTLPTLETAADAKSAASAIVRAVADGDLTPVKQPNCRSSWTTSSGLSRRRSLRRGLRLWRERPANEPD
jgi:Family of unknown function (DUF5681)